MSYELGVIEAGDAYTQALGAGREAASGTRLEVEDPTYLWLTRYLFIGRGRIVGPRQIEYELYRLSDATTSREVTHGSNRNSEQFPHRPFDLLNTEPGRRVELLSPDYKAGALPLSYPGLTTKPSRKSMPDLDGQRHAPVATAGLAAGQLIS